MILYYLPSQVLHRGMARNQAHRFVEEAEAGRNAVPGRGAGWMGKWNQVEGATLVADLERAAYNFVELLEGNELGDGEFAHGNDQLWLEKIDLVVDPGGAIPDLIRRGDPV